MLAKVQSVGVYGIDAVMVEVEVDVSHGFPKVAIVGLPDAAVKESIDRVRSALKNSGYRVRASRLIVNLAPADLRKEGPSFDLPIAMGILCGTEQLVSERLPEYAVVGELALDGRVRPVKGCLPMATECRRRGLRGIILSKHNAREAAVVDGLHVIPVETLAEAVGFLSGKLGKEPSKVDVELIFKSGLTNYELDFSEVKGQEHAKRALLIAAAGNHNVLMVGPPGSGKTMLAQRLPTILPLLTIDEAIETTKVHSVAGMLGGSTALITVRPFRSPHHTVSDAGLVGGGSFPRPGEVSLADHGVLFLDEFPEFDRHTLEVLRQPMEEGRVTISRAKTSIQYPADFMLVAAMNPCPCGYFTDPRRECHCTPHQIQRYLSRISGPLLDRIDIHIQVPAPRYQDLKSERPTISSAEMRDQVSKARDIQLERFSKSKVLYNGRMSNRLVKRYCKLDDAADSLLQMAMTSAGLSARAYTKILKVGRTIADLEGSRDIKSEHVAEAIQYRSLDRNLW